MIKKSIHKILGDSCVIPTAFTLEEFKQIVTASDMACLLMKFGDINTLPHLIKAAHGYNKCVILHMDSIKGISMCTSGIKYLANIGADALITNKPQLVETIQKAGIVAIHNMFLVDSNALKTGIQYIQKYKPDAVNIMPASIEERYIREIIEKTGAKILAGGLLTEVDELFEALEKGISAVVTSKEELWHSKNIVRKQTT